MAFSMNNLGIALGVVAGSLVVAKILDFVIEKLIKKYTKRTKTKRDDEIIGLLHKPIYFTVVLIGLLLALRFVLPQKYLDVSETAISILLIMVFARVLIGLVDILFESLGKSLVRRTKTKLDDEVIPFLSKIAKAAVVLVAFVLILGRLGLYNAVVSLAAGAGIAGIALGFAAKDTLANIFGGIFILTDRPFTKGDRIEVGEYTGEVVEIGLRSTKIKTLDQNFVILPNSKMANTEVTNYTLPDVKIRLDLSVGVAYGSNPEKVKKIILETAQSSSEILEEPQPRVFFEEFGDSSISFMLRVWVNNFRDKWKVRDHLYSQLYDKFDQEEVSIPFPTRTVYLEE